MVVVLLMILLTAYFSVGILFEIHTRNRLDGFEPILVIYFWPIIMIGCAVLITIKFVKNFIKFLKENF